MSTPIGPRAASGHSGVAGSHLGIGGAFLCWTARSAKRSARSPLTDRACNAKAFPSPPAIAATSPCSRTAISSGTLGHAAHPCSNCRQSMPTLRPPPPHVETSISAAHSSGCRRQMTPASRVVLLVFSAAGSRKPPFSQGTRLLPRLPSPALFEVERSPAASPKPCLHFFIGKTW